MTAVFYISSAIAILATILAITRLNAVHALLYLILSLLSVAVIFFTLGAPFAAALEVIVYAGAIMVLFVFVIMLLNIGPQSVAQERTLLHPASWVGPVGLALILGIQVLYIIVEAENGTVGIAEVSAKKVGLTLFGPYLIGVELASILLMAGLVGAYHLGRRVHDESPSKET